MFDENEFDARLWAAMNEPDFEMDDIFEDFLHEYGIIDKVNHVKASIFIIFATNFAKYKSFIPKYQTLRSAPSPF